MVQDSPANRPDINTVVAKLIEIRTSINDQVKESRDPIDAQISELEGNLTWNPIGDAQKQSEIDELKEDLDGLPISQKMCVEAMNAEVQRLYPNNHPVNIAFRTKYQDTLAELNNQNAQPCGTISDSYNCY